MKEKEKLELELRQIGSQLLTIGDALMNRLDDVYVCWPTGDRPSEPNTETSLGIDDPLPTKEQISDILVRWRNLAPAAAATRP